MSDAPLATALPPTLMGFQKDAIHHTFVVPPDERLPTYAPATGGAQSAERL